MLGAVWRQEQPPDRDLRLGAAHSPVEGDVDAARGARPAPLPARPAPPSHLHSLRPVRQAGRPDHEALRWAQPRRRVHWASKRARSCEGCLRGRLWSGAGA